uniref:Uncharacterized protein n=1 Tax=Arundo donax TaxID=35708 RepID=A0A0A9H3X4_ARUDO
MAVQATNLSLSLSLSLSYRHFNQCV